MTGQPIALAEWQSTSQQARISYLTNRQENANMGLTDLISSFVSTVYAEVAVENVPTAQEQPEESEVPESEDPKPAIVDECQGSKECAPLKHHLDECTARVESGSHENCIEEFFHLMHCADKCAAPKLFSNLK
ncbi:ubiquinol-cytochrome C reductase hinge protein-domain-containing protein [Endogone sp. FLAS-F59071]|nr:ubiquinol-cytochrome C reductase hinge protein-domain-containing protein [Endogone sp. FLAS-F59071]|eukprot:RUS18011.1 ubiquinol-cytochrome C reductase hinge protein-domain-containing protein [Endogone sp. FLAS-F59071]